MIREGHSCKVDPTFVVVYCHSDYTVRAFTVRAFTLIHLRHLEVYIDSPEALTQSAPIVILTANMLTNNPKTPH